MSVYIHQGIGYSQRTSAAYIVGNTKEVDGKKVTVPAEKMTTSSSPWANWGPNNDQPIRMAKDIEDCGVLAAGLDIKTRIAIGKGPAVFIRESVDAEGKEELVHVNDSEIEDWFERNDTFDYSMQSVFDLFGYGWAPSQLILSRDRKKINRIKRTDVVTSRLEKRNLSSGLIENMYLSADWSCTGSFSDLTPKIPVLEEKNELEDLLQRQSGFEFALINRQLRNGRHYYPNPLWWSTRQWVEIAKAVPAMKKAMFNNQMTIKYMVTISQNYWKRIHKNWDTFTVDKKQQIISDKLEEIDKYLAGNDNQFKSIFANSYVDPVTKVETADIKIDVLDDKMKDGKLLPDSSAATSEILFALNINPALSGAGSPDGAYSKTPGGSNIREAYMVQLMLLEWERRMNARIFNLVKQYNGWSRRLEKEGKPLVIRYPSGLLTTLDTGKSTKPEIV
ncbi:MAG: hypothetical protein ACTHMV_13545 [Chitinophagaceae bacterium]